MFGAPAEFVECPRSVGSWVDPLVLLARYEIVMARVEVGLSNNEPIEGVIALPDFDVAGVRMESEEEIVCPFGD